MDNSNKILIIIQCGKKKIWAKDPLARSVKAKDAYISNYFKLCRRYAEGFSDKWIILSGKYGIIDPETVIKNYDKKLFPTNKFKIKVRNQLKYIISKRFRQIVSLCGSDYSNFLNDVLMYFGLELDTPLRGKKIGERQRRIKISLGKGKPL
jgi:hypothetical protein